MAIDDILVALEEQGQADIDATLAEAKAHADHVLAEAERQADVIRATFDTEASRKADKAASRTVNAARLEAKMRVSSVKGAGLEDVYRESLSRLGALRSSPEYPQLFARLGQEALAGLQGDVVVHVAPADAALAQQLLASSGLSGRVETDTDTIGGLMVEADEGRILRRNTLEDRLERAKELVQDQVAKALLE